MVGERAALRAVTLADQLGARPRTISETRQGAEGGRILAMPEAGGRRHLGAALVRAVL